MNKGAMDFYFKYKYVLFSLLVLIGLSACHKRVKALPNVNPQPAIDYTYPNNWRAPELTHKRYVMQSGNRPCPKESEALQYIDPLPVIIEHAKMNRLVMINESHSKPLHRLFISEVAARLKDEGYNHYGAELLGLYENYEQFNEKTGLHGLKYLPDVKGLPRYWNEPVYAQVLERLAKLNYRFFAYEGDYTKLPNGIQSGIDFRDGIQADNIARYVSDNPDAKIIIHAGYHHIKETNNGSSMWMAEQLSERYSLNPLTISQTDCYGESYFKDGFMGYAMLADKNGYPISGNGYDMIIAAPPEAQYKERPLWLQDYLGRRFVDLPEGAVFDGPQDFTLITARSFDRLSTAPIEDIIYRVPFSNKVLALRPGHYEITVKDRNDNVLAEVPLSVK